MKCELLFLLFFLVQSAAFAKPETGLDVPGEEEGLNRNLWMAAKGTSYDEAKTYTDEAQEKSRQNQKPEVVLPNGWKIAPAGESIELGTMPGEEVLYAGRLVVLNNGF